MSPETLTALLLAIGTVVGIVISSVRKRQDTSVEELRKKIEDLSREIADLRDVVTKRDQDLMEERGRTEAVRDELQAEQDLRAADRRTIADLRVALADARASDPTRP